jgi:hypothetical protein
VQEKHKEGFGIRISTNICYFPDVWSYCKIISLGLSFSSVKWRCSR